MNRDEVEVHKNAQKERCLKGKYWQSSLSNSSIKQICAFKQKPLIVTVFFKKTYSYSLDFLKIW